jgi:hypothetical protein
LTAVVTPSRRIIPAMTPALSWPISIPSTTHTDSIAEMTAAIGMPTPSATPALAADARDPSVAGASAAPSSAIPGRLMTSPNRAAPFGAPSVSGGPMTSPSPTIGANRTAASTAARRTTRMVRSR